VQVSQEAYVFFEKKMQGTGQDLDHNNIKSLFNAAACLTRGLNKLHEDGYVHSDIKPTNLLVKNKKSGAVVIADFGAVSEKDKQIRGYTEAYRAPELINGTVTTASPSQDAYSAGVTMIGLLVGRTSFIQIKSRYGNINENTPEERKNMLQYIKDAINVLNISDKEKKQRLAFLNIAIKLTDPNPATRMTCKEALLKLHKIAPRYIHKPKN
jgi:serine/threonine protein kinase